MGNLFSKLFHHQGTSKNQAGSPSTSAPNEPSIKSTTKPGKIETNSVVLINLSQNCCITETSSSPQAPNIVEVQVDEVDSFKPVDEQDKVSSFSKFETQFGIHFHFDTQRTYTTTLNAQIDASPLHPLEQLTPTLGKTGETRASKSDLNNCRWSPITGTRAIPTSQDQQQQQSDEEENAVIKIQAGVRGFLARKHLKDHELPSPGEH